MTTILRPTDGSDHAAKALAWLSSWPTREMPGLSSSTRNAGMVRRRCPGRVLRLPRRRDPQRKLTAPAIRPQRNWRADQPEASHRHGKEKRARNPSWRASRSIPQISPNRYSQSHWWKSECDPLTGCVSVPSKREFRISSGFPAWRRQAPTRAGGYGRSRP